MKKYLVALLALVMMFALAIPVFAEPVEVSVPGSSSADIKADYEEGEVDDTVTTVYLVTVDWATESTLKYSDGTTTYKWNANTTKYEAQDPEDQGWTGDAKVTITVTNKSNDAIKASAAWENADDIVANCAFESEKNAVEVASADQNTSITEGKLEGEAVTETIKAIVTVSDGAISEADAKVGTVTLTIEKAE